MKKIITLTCAMMVLLSLFSYRTGVAIQPKFLQQAAPEINEKTWLNSSPLTLEKLKGKVVMVEFWTYGCYNCINVEPYVKSWYKQYRDKGFVVVAVHSPEFSHERKLENVRDYIKRKEITYPVVIDNDFAIWRRYNNRYWPAMYLVDKKGQLRYLAIGEGRYSQTEKMIQTLLEE